MGVIHDEPHACPFCGSVEVGDPIHFDDAAGWAVWCMSCGAQGPAVQGNVKAAKREAVRLWNKRLVSVERPGH